MKADAELLCIDLTSVTSYRFGRNRTQAGTFTLLTELDNGANQLQRFFFIKSAGHLAEQPTWTRATKQRLVTVRDDSMKRSVESERSQLHFLHAP